MSRFGQDQAKRIMFEYAKVKSSMIVRREVRNFSKSVLVNYRMLTNSNTSSTDFWRLAGRLETPAEKISAEETLLDNSISPSISEIAATTSYSIYLTWKILRKELKLHPYKPELVIRLRSEQKIAGYEFCGWLLTHQDSFVKKVLRSDEKLRQLNTVPNRRKTLYWVAVDPCIEVQCKKKGAPNIMCWAGIINCRKTLHWFDLNTTVNQKMYLKMLQAIIWPRSRGSDTKNQLWFQRDSATAHTTQHVGESLETNFQVRIISRYAWISWPARRPNLAR